MGREELAAGEATTAGGEEPAALALRSVDWRAAWVETELDVRGRAAADVAEAVEGGCDGLVCALVALVRPTICCIDSPKASMAARPPGRLGSCITSICTCTRSCCCVCEE